MFALRNRVSGFEQSGKRQSVKIHIDEVTLDVRCETGYGPTHLAKKMETILVVDDAEPVLNVVVRILETAQFHVLHANSGTNALAVAASYPGAIDLLLSDVQMPGMSGPALATTLKQSRPDIHVMFMSAFAGGNLLVLNYGWAFIEKPFVAVKLIEMINHVLHMPNKSQGDHQYDSSKAGEKQG